ncbi:MAG: VanZ family protein [Planctomycetota bacterium]|nr:VanZ family protein [Planctomycetota bacterium]
MARPPAGTWRRLLAWSGDRLLRLPRPAYALVVVLWAGLIWLSSSREGAPEVGTFWWSVLGNLAHAPLFGLLALWLALALPRAGGWSRLSGRDRLVILALVLAWGVTDEWHQSWVYGRDASWIDLCTDFVGALVTLDVARAAGDPESTEAGLRWRLLRATLACVLCAIAATIGY